MLTYNIEINYQKKEELIYNYYQCIKKIKICEIKCSCGIRENFIKFGRYKRFFDLKGKMNKIFVQRLYCKNCKKTHAIIPSFIIPYKHIIIKDFIELIDVYENSNYNSFSIDDLRNIRIYIKWKEKLIKIGLTYKDSFSDIIFYCAKYYKQCFLQTSGRMYQKNGTKYKIEFFCI